MTDLNRLIVTCEHGGNQIPAAYRSLFRGQRELLQTHRGYDAGALTMARDLAAAFGAPLVASQTSRLLVDLNRSIGHPGLYSATTRALSRPTRDLIVADHYRPYRDAVESQVAGYVARGHRAIHISSHSFTPELNGKVRTADVGLLYDPGRPGEVELSSRWQSTLGALVPDLRVRRNYPYAGKGDGLTAHLRQRFPPGDYVGVELEINQRIVSAGGRAWRSLRRTLIDALRVVVA